MGPNQPIPGDGNANLFTCFRVQSDSISSGSAPWLLLLVKAVKAFVQKKSVQRLPQDAESLSLVVRTSCRGRDNPGSTPGGDTARIYAEAGRQKLAKAFSQPSAFPEASVV